jgi:ribosomal protein S24E
MLEKNLIILDLVLKESSFTKASQLGTTRKPKIYNKTETAKKIEENSIPIKRGNDGRIIANAYVTAEQVSIILDDEVEINADTPPFKSFFLDRIIGEMKKKDFEEAENGKIQKESVIDYIINKNGSDIREIIIKNYRQKERVNELINTAGWSLTRMLENINK